MRVSRIQQRIEAEWGRPLERVLWDLYVAQGMTERQCAARLRASPAQIHRLLVACRIPRRQMRAIYTGIEKSTPSVEALGQEVR